MRSFDKIYRIFLIGCFLCFLFISSSLWSQEQEALIYENEAMGIKINGPVGWFIIPGEKVQEIMSKRISDFTNLESIKEATKRMGILVVFSQYPFGSPRDYNPSITLTTEQVDPEYIKTIQDYANANMLTIKAMFKDVRIIKEPSAATLSGCEGINFIYEGTIVMGYLEIRVKSSVYVFKKDDIAYNLTCSDKADNFDNNAKAFESSIRTLSFK